VGWAIGNGEEYPESQSGEQDRIESEALYNILEKDIITRFYDRGRDALPRSWISMMKNAIRELAPVFTTHRMVQEYTQQFYIPNYERFIKMTQPNMDAALAYTGWRAQVRGAWNQIRVVSVNVDKAAVTVGAKSPVTAVIHLGALTPKDVRVQLYYGALNTRGEIVNGQALDMTLEASNGGGLYTFKTTYQYATSGETGFSVRVLPYHEFMHTLFQPGMITWA
jgi:starch phosphorylase